MKKLIVLSSLIVAPAIAVGCSVEPQPAVETGVTGAELTFDFLGGTDVAGFRFELSRVACYAGDSFEPWEFTVEEELEDMLFPGMVPSLSDSPLDGASHHLAGDYFVTLGAGCYDIVATPIQADGDDSEDCSAAQDSAVEVEAGKTTSVFLISQCDGDTAGAINTGVGINHPPEIVVTTYNPTKWLFECQQVTVCATAVDVDSDPIEFDWSKLAGPTLFDGPVVMSSEFEVGAGNGNPSVATECVEFVPRFTADYDMKVTAYDLMGDGTRIEDYLAAHGNPVPSNASLEFPLHVNWEQELQCWNDSMQVLEYLPGVDPVDRAEGCSWTTPADYFCDAGYAAAKPFDLSVTCPGGTFDPSVVYPACN